MCPTAIPVGEPRTAEATLPAWSGASTACSGPPCASLEAQPGSEQPQASEDRCPKSCTDCQPRVGLGLALEGFIGPRTWGGEGLRTSKEREPWLEQ